MNRYDINWEGPTAQVPEIEICGGQDTAAVPVYYGTIIDYNEIRAQGAPIKTEHPVEPLAFPSHEIKPRGNRMDFKCALLGHDWITHSSECRIYETEYSTKMAISVFLVSFSLGLLFPLVARFIFPDDKFRDATCSRCEKCIFDVTDRRKHMREQRKREEALTKRHERMLSMRNKACG